MGTHWTDPDKWQAAKHARVCRLINKVLDWTCDGCGRPMSNLPFCERQQCPADGAYEAAKRSALRVVGMTPEEFLRGWPWRRL